CRSTVLADLVVHWRFHSRRTGDRCGHDLFLARPAAKAAPGKDEGSRTGGPAAEKREPAAGCAEQAGPIERLGAPGRAQEPIPGRPEGPDPENGTSGIRPPPT